MIKYWLCYSVVTPDSAEQGDIAEHGYYQWGGWRFPMPDDCYGEAAAKFREENAQEGTLRDIVHEARDLGIRFDGSAEWAQSEPEIDYRTGEEITYSLHIDNPRYRARAFRFLR